MWYNGIMVKVLIGLVLVCLLWAGYFAIELFTGEPRIAEIIVLPMYIGFGLIGAIVFGLAALVVRLWRGRRK